MLKQTNKGSPNLSTAQAVNVEVESKVEQLKIVCNCTEDLEPKMLVERDREDDGEEGCWSCAADKEDHNGDENQDQHTLFWRLQGLSAS